VDSVDTETKLVQTQAELVLDTFLDKAGTSYRNNRQKVGTAIKMICASRKMSTNSTYIACYAGLSYTVNLSHRRIIPVSLSSGVYKVPI